MMFNGFQTALGPALSHSGFDEIMLGDEKALKNDRLLHYRRYVDLGLPTVVGLCGEVTDRLCRRW